MAHHSETAGEILQNRICKRLADLAREMANDPSAAWKDLRTELFSLDEKSFAVIFDLRKHQDYIFPLIESAVNENTNQQVRDTQGEFSYGDNFPDFVEGNVSLFTFAPDHCKASKQRFAALMVVQRFESLLESIPGRKPGRLKPVGITISRGYGIIQSDNFSTFAHFVNGALDKHALPEDNFGRVNFKADDRPSLSSPTFN